MTATKKEKHHILQEKRYTCGVEKKKSQKVSAK